MKTKRLRIIDSHLHFCDFPGFDKIALEAGHVNNEENLRASYEQYHYVHGIVMSNRTLDPKAHVYPEFLSYCIGLDSPECNENVAAVMPLVEENLKKPQCCGIKLYPGYNHYYVSDVRYNPVYEMARQYDVPVAVHMGLTATDNGLLKYSHPLTLDEAAVKYPDVTIVMCHFANPFLQDAIAVFEKNHNIVIDLSGLLEGKIHDMERFMQEKKGYIQMLHDWLSYVGDYERVMFGTDWPLANLGDYVTFVKAFIPERYWEDVFFNNANRIYHLGLK